MPAGSTVDALSCGFNIEWQYYGGTLSCAPGTFNNSGSTRVTIHDDLGASCCDGSYPLVTAGVSGVNLTITYEAPPPAATPSISGCGAFTTGPQIVTITSSSGGTSLRYTLDGSTPSPTAGTVYTGPFPVNSSVNIQAMAYAGNFGASPISSCSLTFRTIAPSIGGGQTVTITTPTPGATIRYTTDGSIPTSSHGVIYSAPFGVSGNTAVLVKALAYRAGWLDSVPAWYEVAAPALTGFQYSRAITIDHTKVPNTDQSNFPILISGTYPDLRTAANGGNVQNSSGFDIGFAADPAGTLRLDHEIEDYNPATGQVEFWVRVPLLSHATNSDLHVLWENWRQFFHGAATGSVG